MGPIGKDLAGNKKETTRGIKVIKKKSHKTNDLLIKKENVEH